MTEYVLDVSKWRCGMGVFQTGIEGVTALGAGPTQMLNHEGYSCCLGQFAKQKGVKDSDLLGNSSPLSVQKLLGGNFYDHAFLVIAPASMQGYDHTDLAGYLMTINDSPYTDIKDKIENIKSALEESGHTLEVLNGDRYLNE